MLNTMAFEKNYTHSKMSKFINEQILIKAILKTICGVHILENHITFVRYVIDFMRDLHMITHNLKTTNNLTW